MKDSEENIVKSINEKMSWWRESRFGMFIHWGLYSILAKGEWVMYIDRIPVKEYEKLGVSSIPSALMQRIG